MKLTKRKGFNFYRSYYDVYNELENIQDKVAFIDALLDRQFQGVKPTVLKGMAKFAYISQTDSIDAQVKGFEFKTGIILDAKTDEIHPPTVGVSVPPPVGVKNISNTPTVQEKGKEKEKEKEKYIYRPDFDEFLNYSLLQDPTICKVSLKRKYDAWVVNDWKDGNDRKITNWKSKLINTLPFIEKAKSKTFNNVL
jgi:hypothetical protein